MRNSLKEASVVQEQHNQALRERLFSRYSLNLSFHRSDLKGLFVCPQCTRGFRRDALRTGLLSEDHVPPRAVGHQLVTLTCTRCNSWSGAELESNLDRHFQIRDFLRGERSSPRRIARVRAGNGEIGASVHLEDGRIMIVGRKDHSNPELRREFNRYLQSVRGKKGWKFRIQV